MGSTNLRHQRSARRHPSLGCRAFITTERNVPFPSHLSIYLGLRVTSSSICCSAKIVSMDHFIRTQRFWPAFARLYGHCLGVHFISREKREASNKGSKGKVSDKVTMLAARCFAWNLMMNPQLEKYKKSWLKSLNRFMISQEDIIVIGIMFISRKILWMEINRTIYCWWFASTVFEFFFAMKSSKLNIKTRGNYCYLKDSLNPSNDHPGFYWML